MWHAAAVRCGDDGDGGSLGIHIAQEATTHTDPAAVVLQFTTDERLEIAANRLTAAGYAPSDILDETFGRYFTVEDPDGYLVRVNESDADLQNLSYEIKESAALK
jgi:uncharacterized glyoxalase superfamily protein PhnB